jgi:branched-subunit amino acid ABC-type transport system permease component
VVSGLATGCVYALVAPGFVLIFKATDVVNIAQGEFVMASGFIGYTLLIWYRLPYWLVFFLTVLLSGVMGVVLERLVVRPIMSAPIFSIGIATIGASPVMRSAAGIVYSYDVLPAADDLLRRPDLSRHPYLYRHGDARHGPKPDSRPADGG